VSALALACSLAPQSTRAVDPSSNGQTQIPGTSVQLPNAFGGGTLPGALNSGAAAQIAAKFGACVSTGDAMGLAGAVISAATRTGRSSRSRPAAATGLATGLDDACKTTDGKPIGDDLGDTGKLTCDLLQTNGAYDPKQLREQEAIIGATAAVLQCKETKFKQIKDQLSCLTVQANQITQGVNSLQEVVAGSIRKMQKDVGDLNSQSKERESQAAEIAKKLGDGEKDGMIAQQKKTQEAVVAMETAIAAVKEAQIGIQREKASILESAKKRTAALTKECFTAQTRAEFRCYPAGVADNPPLSAQKYLACRYRDTQSRVGAGGRIEQNAALKALGNKKADELDALMDEVFGAAPSSASLNASKEDTAKQYDEVVTVMTPADIERLYGARLRSFDSKGIPVHDYVMKYVGQCHQRSTVTVADERKRVNSTLGRAEEQVRQIERDTTRKARAALMGVATQYTENMRVLTDQHVPLDVSRCDEAQPQIQANCMDEALANLKAQLTGVQAQAKPTTTNYAVNIVIKGNSPQRNINVSCAGLDGCIARLKTYSSALEREQKSIDSFKTQYTQQGYRNVEELLEKARTALQPQSEALRNQLKTMNEKLAALGVDETVEIDEIESEDLVEDERPDYAGLPKIPTSILNVIGSKMQPKLLNVAGNNYSGALKGISKAADDLQKKSSKLSEFQRKLKPLAEKCKADELKESAKALKTDANAYVGCVPELCEGPRKNDSGFSTLMSEVSRISSLSGLSSLNEVSDILSGGKTQCAKVHGTFTAKLQGVTNKINSAQSQLQGASTRAQQAEADLKRIQGLIDRVGEELVAVRDHLNRAPASEKQSKQADVTAKENQLNTLNSQLSTAQGFLQTKEDAKQKLETDLETAKNEKAQLEAGQGNGTPGNCEAISRSLRDKFGDLRDRHREMNSAGGAF
jgi:hypothetical protein